MKYCKNCKADNPEDARYCHMCGSKFRNSVYSVAIAILAIICCIIGIIMLIIAGDNPLGHPVESGIGILSIVAFFIGMYIFAKKAE